MADSRIDIKMMMDATNVQRALTSVKAQMDEFAKSKFAGLKEVFGFAALVAGAKKMGEEMVALRRSAEDVGASIGFLMTLQQMSEKFGGTAEDATVAMTKLAETIGQARMEGGAAAEKFERFGIALYKTNGDAKTSEELFKEIATAYKGMADPALKAALAVEFFGKTGRNINNILAEGADGIEEYNKKFLGLDTGLMAGDVNAIADAWHNLKEFISGAYDVAKMFLGRTIDGLGSIFRLLGAISTGSNPMEAWNQEMEFWNNRDKPQAQTTGNRTQDQEKRVKEIEALTKARNSSAASQMTDEGKLAQVEKDRAEIEKKMAATAEGSVERIKLENDLLVNGYEARKLQLAIAEKVVEQAKLGQQLDAAANQFAINDATAAELAMRIRIAALEEGHPARVGLEKQLGDLVQKRMKMEQDAQRLELQQMIARGDKIDAEVQALQGIQGKELELEKKLEEQRKANLEIAKKTNDIEQAGLNIQKQKADAQERATKASQTLREARESRFKFTLGELATADPRQFRGELRENIMGARQVQRLEALAMQANLRNDPNERDRLQELADKRRESLGFLKKDERFLFQDLKLSAKQSADNLAALLKSGTAKTQVVMAT